MRSDDTRAQRADASTAAGRAQRGTAREREGAFGNAVITAEVRYSPVTKHYHTFDRSAYVRQRQTGGMFDTRPNRDAEVVLVGRSNVEIRRAHV